MIRSLLIVAVFWCGCSSFALAEEPQPPALRDLTTGQETRLFNGLSLVGWRVADEFSYEKHGPVSVAKEKKVEKGEIRLGKGKPATGLAWKGDVPRTDYELTLEAKRLDGEDFFCGLTFPVDKEYCTLILGGWGGKATGLSNVDGMSAIENETTGYEEFKNDRWYRVRLRVTANKIEAWVDASQVVDLKTAGHKFSVWWDQEPCRPLGISSWYTSAALRDIRFRRLAPSERE